MPSYRLLTAIVLFILLTATAVALAHSTPSSPNTEFWVTTAEDTNDGVCDLHCSLREAITAANANPGPDTITFANSVQGYILLSGTQLPLITDALTIGPNVGGYLPAFTIDAANNSRIFEIASGATLGLYRLHLINGSNDQGGAIANFGTLTLMYSQVSHSLATLSPDSKGGAIYNQGTLNLETTTIGTGNESISGGAIYNEGDLTISRSILYGNTADFGAAIYNTGVFTLTNTTVSTNEAANAGGGIYNTAALTLTNATIFGNHATTGNGLVNFTGGTLYAYNTVIATLYDSTSDCANLGLIAANTNNLVEDGSCSPSLTGDPQLTTLLYNLYHQPLPGSPLLDAGDNTPCPPTDQREWANRPGDGDGDTIPVCDIGAIEISNVQSAPHYTVNSAAPSQYDDGFCYVTSCSLAAAITANNLTPTTPTLITFDLPTNTTMVGWNFPTISGTLTIQGSTAVSLTIANSLNINSGALVTLTHLNVSHSSSSGIRNYGATTLLNSTLSHNGNFLEGGIGIYNQGLMSVGNTTISYHGGGGGIQNEGTLTLTHTTLSNNSCYNLHGQCVIVAGGLNNSGTLYWYNSLIANSSGPDCNNTGTIAASVNNLVEDGTCAPTFSGDPLLGPLQYNGGPTPTHALLPGSLAIDTADGTYCLPTDQRDHPRPQDGDNNGTAVCDLGAFEALWSFAHDLPAIFHLTTNP